VHADCTVLGRSIHCMTCNRTELSKTTLPESLFCDLILVPGCDYMDMWITYDLAYNMARFKSTRHLSQFFLDVYFVYPIFVM